MNNADEVLRLVVRLASIGVTIDSLEMLSRFQWLTRSTVVGRAGSTSPLSGPARLALLSTLLLRCVSSAGLVVGSSDERLWPVLVLCVAATSVAVVLRFPLIQGGDSQLTLITFISIAIASMAGTEVVMKGCLYFLCAELAMAYFAAGYHKLRSGKWRNGEALSCILSTRLFGYRRLANWLASVPWLSAVLCWTVIAWELSFPFVLILPSLIKIPMLAFGVLLHISIAMTMGLNKFLWAFCSLYPAVLAADVATLCSLPWGM